MAGHGYGHAHMMCWMTTVCIEGRDGQEPHGLCVFAWKSVGGKSSP